MGREESPGPRGPPGALGSSLLGGALAEEMGRGAGQARVRSLELGPDVFVLQAVLGMGRGSQERKGAACVVWG